MQVKRIWPPFRSKDEPMSMADEPATTDDVRRVFGETDALVVQDIVRLQPTIADLQKAAQWIAGDRDLDQADGQVLKGVAGEIVALLAESDTDEP
jgi:hypothetical protein